MSAQPFKIEVASRVLEDLRGRLERTRWANDVTDTGWQYGTSADYLQDLLQYWSPCSSSPWSALARTRYRATVWIAFPCDGRNTRRDPWPAVYALARG
jgi:hypothetical protein